MWDTVASKTAFKRVTPSTMPYPANQGEKCQSVY